VTGTLLCLLMRALQAHFVEMDPWVVSTVLSPNLAECNYMSQTLIHTMSVESFLDKVEKTEGEALTLFLAYLAHAPFSFFFCLLHSRWPFRLFRVVRRC